MTGVWACNGFFQSCGWTPVVRVIANWFPPAIRDTASGLIGTSYLLGNGMSWLLSGLVTQLLGWRWAFRVPAGICLLLVVVVLLWLREKPKARVEEVKTKEENALPKVEKKHLSWLVAIRRPRLWLLSLAMAGFMFGHHGLLDWTPNYLAEAANLDAATASHHAFWLPLGGTLGCFLLAWFARRTKQQLGPFALAFILTGFAIGIFAFPHILNLYPAGGPLLLLILGGMSSAPASIMACSMPATVAGDGSAAFAAGLVDSMGYVGSMLSGILSGWILSRVRHSQGDRAAWNMVWRTWPIGAVIGAILMTILGFISQLFHKISCR